jgi:hypothetical protein
MMFGIDSSNFWTIIVCVNMMSLMLCMFSGSRFGSCFSIICACMCYRMLISCKGEMS